jgi:hypothetical protein
LIYGFYVVVALLIFSISILLVIPAVKTYAQIPSSTIPTSNLTTTASSTLTNTTMFNLSNNTGFSFFPRIAVSPLNNSLYVVWADNTTGNGDILFRKSSDGGTTFDKIINLSNNTAESSNPQIDLQGSNNIYVVWQDKTPNKSLNNSSNSSIELRTSIDGGSTFGPTLNLNQGIGTPVNPQIVTSERNVYVVWQDKTLQGSEEIIFWKGNTQHHS